MFESYTLLSGLALSALPLLASAQQQNGTVSSQPWKTFNNTPLELNFTVPPENLDNLTPGNLFFCPRKPGDPDFKDGPIITQNDGTVVWDGTAEPYNFGQAMVFEPSKYKGEDVIALWQGQFYGGGYGNGYGLILNSSYDVIANVSTTIPGQGNDFHAFQITENNTAMFTIYSAEQYDLGQWNVQTEDGSSGWILNGHVQEVDIETGDVIFSWSALDHLDPAQSSATAIISGTSQDNAWDFVHLNSIAKDSKGNYLISARFYNALYYVAPSGETIWELHGPNSNFTMGEGSEFWYQHDARWVEEGSKISVFDNAGSGWDNHEATARSMIINLDMDNMTVTLEQGFLPTIDAISTSQGSTRVQPNGNVLSGFGSEPEMDEHDASGNIIWAARLPDAVQVYRVVRSEWTGKPRTEPSIAISASPDNGSMETYISWNGDSQVNQWRLYATQDNSTSADPMAFDKAGFETMYTMQVDWPQNASLYVWAEGMNGTQVVGTTRQVILSRDGQGGVSQQSGVAPASTSNSTLTGGDSGSDSGGSDSDSDSGSGSGGADDSNGASRTMAVGGISLAFAAVLGSALLL